MGRLRRCAAAVAGELGRVEQGGFAEELCSLSLYAAVSLWPRPPTTTTTTHTPSHLTPSLAPSLPGAHIPLPPRLFGFSLTLPPPPQVTVILKHMFQPSEFAENPFFREELERDLRGEAGRCGKLEKVGAGAEGCVGGARVGWG